jgi:hypothetical protein
MFQYSEPVNVVHRFKRQHWRMQERNGFVKVLPNEFYYPHGQQILNFVFTVCIFLKIY